MLCWIVRCPNTGRDISGGIGMEESSFQPLSEMHISVSCPVCGEVHQQKIKDCHLVEPAAAEAFPSITT